VTESRRLRAGVIGVGSMGSNHARVYSEIDGVELAAVADTSQERLKGAKCPAYEDYRRMLDEAGLDLVSVCVPTLLHREVAGAAAERGVALLVEKPIAATPAEGRAMAEAAQRAGVPLMVGHVERFNPAVLKAKELLAAGEVGRPVLLSARRTGPFPERIRDVGVVHDLAPHDIDVMRFLLESEVEKVDGFTVRGIATEHEDLLVARLWFDAPALGILEVSWIAAEKVRRLSVVSEKGLLDIDYLSQEVSFFRGGHRNTMPTLIAVEKAEPLRLELEAFVDALRRGVPPPVTAADGLAALEIASLLVESARTGQVVSVAGRMA
jgi:UDP-N-acetylglucosamine 3-dehydrogenase